MSYSPATKTEIKTISMGPQHPSTHGVLRLEVDLAGELVVAVRPDIGFLHRGLEKMAESRTYSQFVPYCDRMDYVSAFSNGLAYCEAVEKLAGIEVPRRAKWLRSLMLELQRITSHLVWLGAITLDIGATTPFLYTWRERELLLDIFELVTGARLTYSWCRIGGLPNDLPEGFDRLCREFLKIMPGRIKEYDNLVTGNRIVRARMEEIGVISAERALSYGMSGPCLRGSGVGYDVRKAAPFAAYDELNFAVQTSDRADCMGRYLVRIAEMRESLKIIEQCLNGLPEGEIRAKGTKVIKPPAGEVYHHIESPRGDFGVFLVSDGSDKPARARFRSPCFINLAAVPEMAQGCKIADLMAIVGSIDIVLGEIDR